METERRGLNNTTSYTDNHRPAMFVYGIRCAPNDLTGLPADATADYYLDYGLLVFPGFTRASCLKSHGRGGLTADFWQRARLIAQFQHKTHCVTHLEHPWLSPEEAAIVTSLQEFYPGIQADWYYVPRTASIQERDPSSEDD